MLSFHITTYSGNALKNISHYWIKISVIYIITISLYMYWKGNYQSGTKCFVVVIGNREKSLLSPSYSTFNNSIIIIYFLIKRTSRTSKYGCLKDKVINWDEPQFSYMWISSQEGKSKIGRIARDHTNCSENAVEAIWC